MGEIQIVTARSWKMEEDGDGEDQAVAHHYDMGMQVSQEEGGPVVNLYSLCGVDGSYYAAMPESFEQTLYKVCRGIVEDYFPGKAVTDFRWTYTASGARTDINFESQNGCVTGVGFSNSVAIVHSAFASTVDDYEQALENPDTFLLTLSGGHPERYAGSPGHRIIVPLPLHPQGHIMIESGLYEADETREVVLVDSKKLMAMLMRQEMARFGCESASELAHIYNRQPSKGDDVAFPPFHSTLAQANAHLHPVTGYPDTIPWACFVKASSPDVAGSADRGGLVPSIVRRAFTKPAAALAADTLEFINGRHRAVNMMIAGAPYVPMLMEKNGHLAGFKTDFGWDGAMPAQENLRSAQRSQDLRR